MVDCPVDRAKAESWDLTVGQPTDPQQSKDFTVGRLLGWLTQTEARDFYSQPIARSIDLRVLAVFEPV